MYYKSVQFTLNGICEGLKLPVDMLKGLKPCKLYNEIKVVTDYQQAWRYQKVMTEHAGVERKKGNFVSDSVILVQHQSLYTLGRGATLDNLKFSPHAAGKRDDKIIRL